MAIPTKIINDFLQKPSKPSSSKKFSSNEPTESTTIHYENSNGFVPLIVSTQPYESKQNIKDYNPYASKILNGTRNKALHTLEDNPIFSTEARFFLNLPNLSDNRRSFHADDNGDEFDFLKVGNGTPAIAKYDYSKSTPKPDLPSSNIQLKSSLRIKNRERGKRIQSYLGDFDATNGEGGKYLQSEVTENKKKNVYQGEKTYKGYKQDSTGTYLSQRVTLPKTNYASMTTPKYNIKIHVPSSVKNEEHRFKSPIMVEPSEYKVDVRFNGQSVQSVVSTANPQIDSKDQMDSANPANETPENSSRIEGTNRNYESADSRDFSEENPDYIDVMEKPRRLQKSGRKRVNHFDSSRKLPKEHREVYDDAYDDHGRKRPSTRSKSRYRQPLKIAHPVHEDEQYDNEGDHVEENINNSNIQQNFNEDNTWNQVAPNIEVSHSNGFEINQIEKPKLHIVPVNILSNFDHATALDNSQGFDITNAMFTGFIGEGSLVSTAAPLLNSPSNHIEQNFVSSTTMKPLLGISTSVPDVIVGQSSFQNPVQAVLMPNKLQENMLNQYIQSTVSPTFFAVTQRPSYSASSSVAPNFHQMLNQVQASLQVNQLMNPQPQSFTNDAQPVQSNTNDQIRVNPNGFQESDSYHYEGIQATTSRSNTGRGESRNKKNFNRNNGQFVASASLSVDQDGNNDNRSNNKRKINNSGNNSHNNYNSQNPQQTTRQNSNTIVQPTVIPAILHTGIGLINNQNQQLVQSPLFITNPQQNTHIFSATNDAFQNTMRQLQYDIQNNRYQLTSIPGIDNIGGASSNVQAINNLISPLQKAQLPILGAKNVEILNPNLNTNAYAINQIPAALVTTPIPIITTSGFISPKQAYSSTTQEPGVSVQNFVHALTQIGTSKPNSYRTQNFNPLINLQGPDRQLYNPINFVPNYDLVKSQTILNNNFVPSDPFTQQNLNLVPVVPGGSFYKHTQGAQIDLANKPKLNSDLEKYAEEMFKESVRTIYNTHKWNNDYRWPQNVSLVDNSDLAKLRNELLRIKNNLRASKVPKDVLEAQYTDNKIRTAKPGSDYKRPDLSIEQPHKDHKHHSSHISGSHHHHHHHSHNHKQKSKINDYLTPPRAHSFISKSPFHEKPQKKRPGHGPRPNHHHENSRLRPRQGVASPKPQGLESQGTAIIDYRYPAPSYQDKPRYSPPDYQGSQSYPTFTTSSPENGRFKASAEYRSLERDYFDINHQRTHNLMGLLMKNKQLPPYTGGNNYRDSYTIGKMFDEQNQRTQSQAYEDVLTSFQMKSDSQVRSIPLTRISKRAYSKMQHKV